MADDNTGTGPDNSGGADNDDDQNQDGTGDGGTGTGNSGDDDKPVTREEFNKLFEKMRNADRRATAAEKEAKEKQKKLDEIETAKLGDVEKAKKEAADALAERDERVAELKKTRLETAFIKHAGVTWHDADTAYAILSTSYMSDVAIGDDGVVTGMADAVKKLVKDKPFLVNTGVAANGATGSSHNSRKGDTDEQKKARQAELTRRMPNAFRPR